MERSGTRWDTREGSEAHPRPREAAYLSQVPLQLLSWLNAIHSLGHSCHACHVAGLVRGHHPVRHTHHGSLHAPHIACRHSHGGNHSRGSWLSYHAYWWGHHAPHDTVRWCDPRETGVSCGICHLSRSHEHCCQENTHKGLLKRKRHKVSPILTSYSFPGGGSPITQLGILFSTVNQQNKFLTGLCGYHWVSL